MITKCINCQTDFETNFDTKKYCSTNCKQEHFYKRKLNINNMNNDKPTTSTSQEQRIFAENSPDNNKRLFNENITFENRPREKETDGYLQKYIESIILNCSLQSKLDITNYILQQKEKQENEEEEEEEEGEEETKNEEQEKFFKSLNGLLPLALSKILSNGQTKKPV